MSVIGPQKRLTQYTGVENTTAVGRWAAMPAAIVDWWSSGSGISPPAEARESIDAGDAAGVLGTGFSLGMAVSPTAGMAGRSTTWKLVSALRCLPSLVPTTRACQLPALSQPARA